MPHNSTTVLLPTLEQVHFALLSYVNKLYHTYNQNVIWWTKATSNQKHTGKASTAKPKSNTYRNNYRSGICHCSDTWLQEQRSWLLFRNSQVPTLSPFPAPKTSSIQSHRACAGLLWQKPIFSITHFLIFAFKEGKEMGKNKASLIQPMSKQRTLCARAALMHLALGLNWQRDDQAMKGSKTVGAT